MASSKNNENTLPILGGSYGERIFYIITVITAVGVALGDGRHYNSYYVKYPLPAAPTRKTNRNATADVIFIVF